MPAWPDAMLSNRLDTQYASPSKSTIQWLLLSAVTQRMSTASRALPKWSLASDRRWSSICRQPIPMGCDPSAPPTDAVCHSLGDVWKRFGECTHTCRLPHTGYNNRQQTYNHRQVDPHGHETRANTNAANQQVPKERVFTTNGQVVQ